MNRDFVQFYLKVYSHFFKTSSLLVFFFLAHISLSIVVRGLRAPRLLGDYRWRGTETPTNAKRAFGVDLALQ